MADITLSLTFTVAKGLLNIPKRAAAAFDISSNKYLGQVITVPTTPIYINTVGIVDNLGYAVFTNLDTVNAIEIGLDTGDEYVANFSPFAQIPAGRPALIPLSPFQIYYVQAINAPVDVDMLIMSE
jgi:hypothetical protein